jgi:HEAT repeat protein
LGIRRQIELLFATLGALILAAVVPVIVQEGFACSPTPELVKRLRSPDSGSWTRRRTAVCLAEASISTAEQWTAVVEALNDSDEQVRRRMVTMLTRQQLSTYQLGDDALPPLLKALHSSDPRVQVIAIQYLQFGRFRPANLPAIVDVYEDPRQDATVRRAAGWALTEIGDASSVPSLVKALRDPDARIRGNAALRIKEIGPKAAAAIPALSQLLDDRDARVRELFAQALGAVAQCATADAADTAVAALVAQLRLQRFSSAMLNAPARADTSREQFLQMVFAQSPIPAALMQIGPAGIPPMIAAADHESAAMRLHAAVAMGHLRECPRKWGSPLTSDPELRRLYHFYAPMTVPKLLTLMKDDSPDVRVQAIASLGLTIRFVDDRPEDMALITRGRQDQNPLVREGVEKALAEEARFARYNQEVRERVQKELAEKARLEQAAHRSTR